MRSLGLKRSDHFRKDLVCVCLSVVIEHPLFSLKLNGLRVFFELVEVGLVPLVSSYEL